MVLYSVFDVLREEVPLDRVVSANGNHKTHCVVHDDHNPSMHVYDDHVHCYVCGFHGDVVDVWRATRKIDRSIEAAFDLAREFNVQLPELSEEGHQRAEKRRQKEEGYLGNARACHRNLEGRVREWWESRGFGKELRERFLLGSNHEGTAATIPFWHRGRVKGLIWRNLEGERKYILPSAKDLVDGYKPLFIPDTATGEVFLVEGFIDALALAALGKSTIAIGGTGLSDSQLAELKRLSVQFYILPDRDERGAEAAPTWARRLYPNAKICPADYGEGNKDIADLFATDWPSVSEHLNRLVSTSRDILDIEMERAAEIKDVRERLAYATQHIAPLLAPIHPAGLQDATADIVAEKTNLKKSWLKAAIKDEEDRLEQEWIRGMVKAAEEEQARKQAEYAARVAEAQPEIDELLAPGVLDRLRDTAARMHSVYGDREPLELALLVALGAQLQPLPNGRPLGASILLSAPPSRGKNHIIDAAVKPLPEDFYFAFEIASGQSLYYKAEEDPDFLKHTFAYPNEIEGAEALWEFLRPMLSKGRALKIVTAKDIDGNSVSKTIVVEGPVTVAIPTIRNKTDEQLQTRLLLVELPDYVGRVKEHSRAVSEQLLLDAAQVDYSREKWLWQEGLKQLTRIRRVVTTLRHPDFAYSDDNVSHGARLWANLLSLMATNAWLEQRNRKTVAVGDDEVAIVAEPEDYEVAYRIFQATCKFTVAGLKDVHRKILNAMWELEAENPDAWSHGYRQIAEKAGVALGTITNHKRFLVDSLKFLREAERGGLALVEGAEPSWWEAGDIMKGMPTPDQVRAWFGDDPPPDCGGRPVNKTAEQVNTAPDNGQKPHAYAENTVQPTIEQELNAFSGHAEQSPVEQNEHVQQVFNGSMNSENGLPKPETSDEGNSVHVFSESRLSTEEVLRVKELIREGMKADIAREAVLKKRRIVS